MYYVSAMSQIFFNLLGRHKTYVLSRSDIKNGCIEVGNSLAYEASSYIVNDIGGRDQKNKNYIALCYCIQVKFSIKFKKGFGLVV